MSSCLRAISTVSITPACTRTPCSSTHTWHLPEGLRETPGVSVFRGLRKVWGVSVGGGWLGGGPRGPEGFGVLQSQEHRVKHVQGVLATHRRTTAVETRLMHGNEMAEGGQHKGSD